MGSKNQAWTGGRGVIVHAVRGAENGDCWFMRSVAVNSTVQLSVRISAAVYSV